MLNNIGMGPISYALLTLMPHVGQLVTPALWGWIFSVRMRLALILAPSMLVVGQICICIGTFLLERTAHSLWSAPTFAIGFVLMSCSKAGLAVLQHSCLALILPSQP